MKEQATPLDLNIGLTANRGHSSADLESPGASLALHAPATDPHVITVTPPRYRRRSYKFVTIGLPIGLDGASGLTGKKGRHHG